MDDKQATTTTSPTSGSAVTLGEFNAFLAAKAPEKPCSDCGETEWGIPGENAAVHRAFMANEVSRQGRDYYPITCQNCGLVKLFAADVIERWAEANHNG